MANVTIKRPNKLRAVRDGESMDQRFFYDGKTLTLYSPREKVYATEAAPDTVERMIDFARETVGIVLPAADLVYRNAFPLMMQDVSLAVVVGKAVIGGVKCDHLLFSRPGVDFQIWIAEGKRPFPHKYVVTETDTPEQLSVTTVLSDWKTDACRGRRPVQLRAAQGDQRDSLPAPDSRRVRAAEADRRTAMKSAYKIAGALIVLGALSLAEIAGMSVGLVSDAHAFRGRGAAFVVGAAAGSASASSAQADAAASQQQAAAAQQQAAAAQQQASR